MDGIYHSVADLGKSNDRLAPYPFCHEGRLRKGYWDTNAITWWILAEHGIPLYGPSPSDLGFHVSWVDLRNALTYNVVEYWPSKIAFPNLFLDDEWVMDGVLTVCRIFYTLTERNVTSKLRAGQFAMNCLSRRWHVVIKEAMRLKVGRLEPVMFSSKTERADEVTAFLNYLLELCKSLLCTGKNSEVRIGGRYRTGRIR
jgi:hypothetical protein